MAEHKPHDDTMESTSCWLEDQIAKRLLAEAARGHASQSYSLSAGPVVMSEAKQPVTSLLPDEKNSNQFCAFRAKKLTPFPKAHLILYNEDNEEEQNTARGSRKHEERPDCNTSKPRSWLLCGAWSCFKAKNKKRPNDELRRKKRDEQRNHSNMSEAFDEMKKDNRCHFMVGEKNSSDLVSLPRIMKVAGTNSDVSHDGHFPRGDAYKKWKGNFHFFPNFPQMTRTKPNQIRCDSFRGTAKNRHCSDETPPASTKVFSPSHSILLSQTKMKVSDSSSQHIEVKRVSFRENAEVIQHPDTL